MSSSSSCALVVEQAEWNTLYCILITYQLHVKWNAIVAEVAVEDEEQFKKHIESFTLLRCSAFTFISR